MSNLVLLIDTSGSMRGTRIDQAKRYAQNVITNHRSHVIWGFTNVARKYNSINELSAGGGTRITAALKCVFRTLKRDDYLILVTDAQDSVNESDIKTEWASLLTKGADGEAVLLGSGGGATDVLKKVFNTEVVADNALSGFVDQMSAMHAQVHRMTSGIDSIAVQLETASRQQQVSKQSIEQLESNLKAKKQECSQIAKDLFAAKEKFSVIQNETKTIKSKAVLVKTRSQLREVQTLINASRRKLNDCSKRSREMKQRLRKQERELSRQRIAAEEKQIELLTSQDESMQFHDEYDAIEEQILALQETTPDSRKLPALLRRADAITERLSQMNGNTSQLSDKLQRFQTSIQMLGLAIKENEQKNEAFVDDVRNENHELDNASQTAMMNFARSNSHFERNANGNVN